MKKVAVLSGLTGQDGSYLADFLLEKDYKVYGLVRRTSSNTLNNAEHLKNNPDVEIVQGDILDSSCLNKLCKLARPEMVFHLAAQSHVGISFKEPQATMKTDFEGTLNFLEAIRDSGTCSKFYFAASSEMFGGIVGVSPQNEETPFYPKSPYGVAKLASYWITKNYRESYHMFNCNGILFNHGGPRRGEQFVERKITKAVANIKKGLQDKLYLGNLETKRDWGHSKDYVEAMYLMLQHNKPDDYVIASGETHSIREACDVAFSHVGLDYRDYVEIDPQFYRPAEVEVLLGDSSKARKVLGWKPKYTFESLIKEMVDYDISLLK